MNRRLPFAVLMLSAATLVAATAPANAFATPAFARWASYPLGGEMVSVATGDLNGDGVTDALTTAYTANELAVFLGQGDGTFTAHGTIPVDTGPVSVAVGDVNRDGHLDAVLGYGGQSISVLLGRGDGSFAPALEFGPIEFSTAHVALADVDGDGVLDVVAGESTIFHGRGDGTFIVATKPFGRPTGTAPMALADLNGDGVGDVVTASTDKQGSVAVILSRPNGTYRPAVDYKLSLFPTWASLADVNGDGKLDVVAGGVYGQKAKGKISVLLGTGRGKFRHGSDRTVGSGLSAGVVTDLDGDHRPDVVVVGDNPSRTDASVWVLHGNRNGTFAAAKTFGPIPKASGWATLAVADTDADTRPDILVSSRTSFTIYLNHTPKTH